MADHIGQVPVREDIHSFNFWKWDVERDGATLISVLGSNNLIGSLAPLLSIFQVHLLLLV
jgi:hypothetical protein